MGEGPTVAHSSGVRVTVHMLDGSSLKIEYIVNSQYLWVLSA